MGVIGPIWSAEDPSIDLRACAAGRSPPRISWGSTLPTTRFVQGTAVHAATNDMGTVEHELRRTQRVSRGGAARDALGTWLQVGLSSTIGHRGVLPRRDWRTQIDDLALSTVSHLIVVEPKFGKKPLNVQAFRRPYG